jgi:hypothetical protein
MKKKCVIFFIFFLPNITTHAHIQAQAEQWIDTYIYSPSNKKFLITLPEVQLLLNLIYLSYKRSQMTVEIQPLALHAFSELWSKWSHIINTRLDTSKEIPQIMYSEQENNPSLSFWEAYINYCTTIKKYNAAVQTMLHGTICNDTTHGAILALRSQAREIVTAALTDIHYHLNNTSSTKQRMVQNILNLVSCYIPSFMEQSFIKANQINITMSEEAYKVLQYTQEIGNYTWHTIETARSHFYKIYYYALYAFMKKHGIQAPYFMLLFDENGMIDNHATTILMPIPSELVRI